MIQVTLLNLKSKLRAGPFGPFTGLESEGPLLQGINDNVAPPTRESVAEIVSLRALGIRYRLGELVFDTLVVGDAPETAPAEPAVPRKRRKAKRRKAAAAPEVDPSIASDVDEDDDPEFAD